MLNVKSISSLCFSFGFALIGCKTAAPPAPPATPVPAAVAPVRVTVEPALKPAAAAASAWGMTLLVAAPMKVVADLDALSKSLELPISLGQSFLPMLTSGAGPGGVKVERETLERLDGARPLAVIWLASRSGVPDGWCAALAFKERSFALDALQKIGPSTGQGEGGSQRKTPSGDMVWGAVKDRQLLLSGSQETLLAAGALAITAQTMPMRGQALFTINPSIMAKSAGQPLDALATAFINSVIEEMEKEVASKKITPASKKMGEAVLKSAVGILTDISVARISLEVGAKHGVVLHAEIQPNPGSALASKAAHVSPYAFDLGLPVASDAGAAVAWGDMASWMTEWKPIMEASGPAGLEASQDLAKLFSESINGGSCSADLAAPSLAVLCSLTVRPGVEPSRALTGYLGLLESSNKWEAELENRKPSPLKLKRSGKIVEIDKTVEKKDPKAMQALKALFGGDVVHSAITVKDGRLVMAMGPKPRELLDRYGKAPAAHAAPVFKQVLLDSAGADYLAVVDVMSAFSKFAALTKQPAGQQMSMVMAAVPGLSELRAPIVLLGTGGALPSMEMEWPFGSLQNVARVVSGFMGQMGATK